MEDIKKQINEQAFQSYLEMGKHGSVEEDLSKNYSPTTGPELSAFEGVITVSVSSSVAVMTIESLIVT